MASRPAAVTSVGHYSERAGSMAHLCQGLETPSPGSCFPVTIHCHVDDGETGYPPNMGSPVEDDGIPEGQRPTGSARMLQITQARAVGPKWQLEDFAPRYLWWWL